MKEYIERQAVIDELLKGTIITSDLYGMGIMSGLDFAVKKAADAPAADVVEVRHSAWVKRGYKWQCPECKVLMSVDGTPQENLLYYCPNCGAKMDKEEA